MTDSGSFDSGDLMYGADLAALHALVAATCGSAGVAGPGYASSVFASGSVCAAAHANDLVAAYQRAWDASANKPGTRQSQVAAGGLVYGSLFQNMWTQLGQMSFIDSWSTWDGGDIGMLDTSNVYICAMDGSTATETGVGCGLSGSDLDVATAAQAATGSPARRYFPGAGSTTVSAAVRNLVASQAPFTVVMKLNSVELAGTNMGLFHLGGEETGVAMHIYGATGMLRLYKPSANPNYDATTANGLPTSGDVYVAVWRDASGYMRHGFTTAFPAKLSDFPSGNLVTHSWSTQLSGTNWCYMGCNTNQAYQDYNLKGYMHWFAVSPTCLIDNNA